MEEKKLVPKLRFPGFTEPWEQRKLADILSRRKENRCIDSAYPRLAFAAGQGVIPLSERRTNNRDQLISDEKNKKYLVTYYNDIVYNPANLKYGAIDRNKYGQGVISPIYVTFTSNICSGFVEHIVKSHEFKEKVLSFEEGTVTKRQAVNPDNLLKIDVVITSNSKEQEKISKLFELIDRFITLHQRKLEHLKLKKKSLLQKLFPKEGEVYPELRFPGFTDPWEQRKFSELFEYERPDAYIVQSDLYCDEYNVPVLTANKAFILGYTNEECTYNKPSIIFDDFTLDRKYVDFPYMLKSSAIKILTAKEHHNLRFLFERLNSTRFEVLGHARHYIGVVQNTSTLCPTLDEENCISTILTKVDTLITLHQRKLEHLQLLKKALLQQLFV